MSDQSSFAEIASLFQDSLNDLTTNDRWQIGNLTMIAKEHIEAAQEISTSLEMHIKNTAPSRKLPALYVLDSIVKNVGSPYTIYLGQNLYSIFMDSYTLVDNQTRRAMESMLRTWQKPLTTMDTTPVFPVNTTTGIDNALTKARAILNRGQPPPGQYRNTPPPPQAYQNGYHRATPPLYGQSPFPPPPNPEFNSSMLASLGHTRPNNDLRQLQDDIKNVIARTQQEFARNVYDVAVQKRLQALLDLEKAVNSQQLPPETIVAIKTQVASLAAATAPAQSLQPMPAWQPQSQSYQATHATSQSPFPAGALDALLAATAKPSTPTFSTPLPALPGPPVPTAVQIPGGAASLIDALRAAGLTPSSMSKSLNSSIPPPPVNGSVPPPASAADLLRSLQGLPALSNTTPQALGKRKRAAPTQADLKVFRPEILAALYDSQPVQCSTCGRRFPGTDAGRSAKSAHLDWHFRTNQRIADAAMDSRAQYRKFYIDEMPWIQLPNFDPSSGVSDDFGPTTDGIDDHADGTDSDGYKASSGQRADGPSKEKYIPVPTAGKGTNTTCPVCQEPFSAIWHDQAQEWVWMDAMWVGKQVFHATCHDEISKSTPALGSGPGRVAGSSIAMKTGSEETPTSREVKAVSSESSLGKRKAEDVLASLRAKLTKGTV